MWLLHVHFVYTPVRLAIQQLTAIHVCKAIIDLLPEYAQIAQLDACLVTHLHAASHAMLVTISTLLLIYATSAQYCWPTAASAHHLLVLSVN